MYEALVKRLRELHPEAFGNQWDFAYACQQLMHEAADAIDGLEKACEEAYNKGLLEGGIAQRAEDEKWLPKWIPVTEENNSFLL